MSELFDLDKMEKSIKHAKRRSSWKTVLITIGVLAIIGIGSVLINRTVTPLLEQPIRDSFYLFDRISGANELISEIATYPGVLGGENHYKKFKFIEGKVVYTGEGGYGYGLFRNEVLNRMGGVSSMPFSNATSEDDLSYTHYNLLGQRQMNFFYPFIDYANASNDLALLDEIGDTKVMEMALSFDQGYTSSDAMALIPKGVTKTWLWVKDVDENGDFYVEQLNEQGETTTIPMLRDANTVYGFSLLNANGDKAEMPAENFIAAISSGPKLRSIWQDEFKRLNETISRDDGVLSVADLEIYGAVVTGTAESLAELKDLPFIKASSLGVIVDKY